MTAPATSGADRRMALHVACVKRLGDQPFRQPMTLDDAVAACPACGRWVAEHKVEAHAGACVPLMELVRKEGL